jgi:quinol monooxygenase YgiN
MSSQIVRFTVSLTIAEGKLNDFEQYAKAMLTASRDEQGTLGYDWCLAADRRQCRLLETYKDANAVLAHLKGPVVREYVPKLLGVAALGSFEVYGNPGPEASAMLAGFGAVIFSHWHEF